MPCLCHRATPSEIEHRRSLADIPVTRYASVARRVYEVPTTVGA